MNKKKIILTLAAALGILVLGGCGSENQKTYEQAGRDLDQGSYDYAISGYEACIAADYKATDSLRGAGIAALRQGSYESAADYFTRALSGDKVSKSMQKDLLSYRAAAELKAGQNDSAMADCQELASNYEMDADTYYLSGCVALAMYSYDEASADFTNAFGEDSGYDMAIQIYEAYAGYDMKADGTRYLEASLANSKDSTTEEYVSRGEVYYYMGDYENARSELQKAVDKNSTEGMLLLGTVYMAQEDTSNARSMYQQYVNAAGEDQSPARGYNGLALCDIADGAYDSALSNISTGLENASTEEMQDLLFNEIVVYEKKLDWQTALTKAQEYAKMFPSDENVARELTFLNSRVNGGTSAENTAEDFPAEETASGESGGTAEISSEETAAQE